jgi:transposase
MKKYRVTLTAEERQQLHSLIAAEKAAAKKLAHARILLKADASPGGPAWTDERIAEAVEVDRTTVERVRQRFVEQGLEAALVRKPQDRPSRERKLDGAGEARLVALACSDPPAGRSAWTLQLLADKLVELQVVDSISDETVRQVLKKTNSSRG